jgi:hypothetical protein
MWERSPAGRRCHTIGVLANGAVSIVSLGATLQGIRWDLVAALTTCPAEKSNNYEFKPIGYEISEIGA